jgi:hypothetical protein
MKEKSMRQIIAAAALILASGPALAAPSFCTGTTDTVASGGSVTAAFLLGTGNCMEAGDKVFGAFTSSGAITGNGSSSFSFLMNPGNVTIGFSGVVDPLATGGIVYTVATDPALSQGFLIDDLEKDFTFNAANETLPASATLTGSTTASSFAFDCTRTVDPSGGTPACPQTAIFTPVAQMTVDETITTGTNAIVTALTDTISQTSSVSEPGSIALLGAGLAGLGLLRLRRRPKGREIAATLVSRSLARYAASD